MEQECRPVEEFVESILGEISTKVISCQAKYSPIYQEYRNHYFSWIKNKKLFKGQSGDSTVTDAFIDYEAHINDYCFVQGILGAVENLLGQSIKAINLEQIPGHADKEQKLTQICQSFIDRLPSEAHEEVNNLFAMRKQTIEDSQGYFYLAGYEIMARLLKRVGYEFSDAPMKRLYKEMSSCRPSILWKIGDK